MADFDDQELGPDILAIWWRTQPRKWINVVKKAFYKGKLQESIAHETRGWHHTILTDLQRLGCKFLGGPGKPPDGTHQCHCGKLCRSAQGLAVHKMKVHGERAPESRFLESPLCPVCMTWFWTVHRLRMHLSYVPRDGSVNRCFSVLSRSTINVEPGSENKEYYEIPTALRGMRLDAISVEGPYKPLLSASEAALNKTHQKIEETNMKLRCYPDLEDIDLEVVEKASGKLTSCTLKVLREDGQPEDLASGWSRCLDLLCRDYDVNDVEVIFIEWGREILPEVALEADDCLGGAKADEAFYELAKDFDYFAWSGQRERLLARRRHLSELHHGDDPGEYHIDQYEELPCTAEVAK